ncbi:MAG: ABC transporter permease [Bacteroidales bacterium]|nr:ABC transporter permease [Bacteroidales bacterium]
MFKNFIIITLRSLINHWLYTLLNILGLAVGIACSLLISIYLIHEMSYDKFHHDSERIYRVSLEGTLRGQPLRAAISPPLMAETAVEKFDGVEDATRIIVEGAWLIRNQHKSFNEDKLFLVDTNFLDFFTFPAIKGNTKDMLGNNRGIVLTRSMALKYFGKINVVGKELQVETFKEPFTIMGVLEDIPSNSHVHFDFLIPIKAFREYPKKTWIVNHVYTYIKLKPKADPGRVEGQLDSLVWKYVIPEAVNSQGYSYESFLEKTNVVKYKLNRLDKIHLTSDLDAELEDNSKALYTYTFGIIAILILIIACFNFINMSTANSANRAREVVLRKVLGSNRKLIILQFLTESVIFSFAALFIALLLSEILMPQFNKLLGLDLKFDYLKNFSSIGIILVFTLLLGLLAGIYPAFFVSSYKPVRVLHGVLSMGVKSRKLRSAFVIIQFSISILIIVLALVVYNQVRFMMDMELGFNADKVLVIRRPDALKENIGKFKEQILEDRNVEAVSNTRSLPGRTFAAASFTVGQDSLRRNLFMNRMVVSREFFETYQIELLQGRLFDPEKDTAVMGCVINEVAARKIGGGTVIGQYLKPPKLYNETEDSMLIVGIVNDFHFESVDKPIDPLVILLMHGNMEGFLNVRISGQNTRQVIDRIEKVWKVYAPAYPFQYFFLNEDYNKNYASFIRTGKILLIFAILSILIACLGLFGLVLFTSNQRTREIGIRKSLGATQFRIVIMVIGETLLLAVYSSLIAWPLAYYLGRLWLKDFHAPIGLSPAFFIEGSVIVTGLSLLVVLYQSVMAARSNPADSLKVE